MSRFICDILIFGVLQLTLWGGLVAGFYRPNVVNPIMTAVNVKHDRLASAPPPRVIFVGGSNVLYGIDGATARAASGREPVNMGLIAGLRLNYMLAEVEPSVRAGDVVVLALEPRQVMRAFEGGRSATVLAQVLEQRPGNVAFLEWGHVKELMDHGIVPQAGFAVQQATRRLTRTLRGKPAPTPEPFTLSPYGDLMSHRDKPMRPNVLKERPLPRRFDLAELDPAIARMNAFAAHCRARGAEAVFTWCPIPATHYARLAKPLARIEAKLHAELAMEVIGRPGDFAFPDADFFDSAFHLGSTQAIVQRTQRIADALQLPRPAATPPPGNNPQPPPSSPAPPTRSSVEPTPQPAMLLQPIPR